MKVDRSFGRAPTNLVTSCDMSGVRNWLDDRVELAIRERNDSYDVWSGNVNDDRLWVDYYCMLMERKYSDFVSVNLDPGLPPKKLYDNLRRLCVINGERFSNLFLTRP
jgi:hypothetical protein